jgi:hypothetical protein
MNPLNVKDGVRDYGKDLVRQPSALRSMSGTSSAGEMVLGSAEESAQGSDDQAH